MVLVSSISNFFIDIISHANKWIRIKKKLFDLIQYCINSALGKWSIMGTILSTLLKDDPIQRSKMQMDTKNRLLGSGLLPLPARWY